MTAKIGDGDRRDFDETRRLLYMALLANGTKRYNLAGTLINALAHHHAVDVPVDEITRHVVDAVETADEASLQWVQAQIDRITYELGD